MLVKAMLADRVAEEVVLALRVVLELLMAVGDMAGDATDPEIADVEAADASEAEAAASSELRNSSRMAMLVAL